MSHTASEMGCISSAPGDGDGGVGRVEAATGDYVAKQKVTIWSYSDGGGNLSPSMIPANSRVEVGAE